MSSPFPNMVCYKIYIYIFKTKTKQIKNKLTETEQTDGCKRGVGAGWVKKVKGNKGYKIPIIK